jgi:GNAT superfamily N-acetyltransferase
LTEIDYRTHFAWGAELATGKQHLGIGLARYVCQTDDPATAEAAVAVLDEYQGRGLGGILLALLAESAQENGVKRFRSYVLSQNRKVLDALTRPGIEWQEEADGDTVRFDIPLPLPEDGLRDSALSETLRAVARGEIEVRPVH